MKSVTLIIIAVILCFGITNAQITPSTSKAILTESDRTAIEQRVSRHTTFTIDKTELVSQLRHNGNAQLQLQIDENLYWTIDLEVNDMRALGFRQEYTTDEGTFQCEIFILNTFRGRTSNNQVVRFTIDEDNFFGVIFNDKS